MALRIHMSVRRLRDRMAYLYRLHPRMGYALVNQRALLRVRLEHTTDKRTARARIEIVDRRRGSTLLRVSTRGRICCIQAIRRLCNAPRQLLEVQTIVYNTDCPYID